MKHTHLFFASILQRIIISGLLLFSLLSNAQCWKTVTLKHAFGVAIRTDGTLWSWGRNSFFHDNGSSYIGNPELGQGLVNYSCTPKQIGNDNTWVSISSTSVYTIAIKNDGTLWSWGENLGGSLGNNNDIDIVTPTQIGTENNWKSVSAGYNFVMAIKTDGTLWGWKGGSPNSTMAGISQRIPMQLGTNNDWKVVSCGYDHALALKNDNTLWSCGANYSGQLGNGLSGTYLEQNTFTQIGIESNWMTISAGEKYSLAIKNNNTLWGWGKNDNYQLGDGTIVQKTIPTQI